MYTLLVSGSTAVTPQPLSCSSVSTTELDEAPSPKNTEKN